MPHALNDILYECIYSKFNSYFCTKSKSPINNFNINMNIDITEDITLAFIVSILGIAFPIIIQTISGIDTKYGSTRLIHKIERSWQFKFMCITLGISLLARIYYCFAPPRISDYGKWNLIIEYSAIILCFITTVLLIISLVLFTFKILLFYKPDCLLKSIQVEVESYYKKRNNQSDSKATTSYQRQEESHEDTLFLDLNDLAIYIVNSKNENTVQQLFQSIYDIAAIFIKTNGKEVQYPPIFYDLIRSVNQTICQQPKQFRSVSNTNITNAIFLNTIIENRISQPTYSCVWQCLMAQLYSDRQDLIFQYWVFAYQYYTFTLKKRLYVGDIINKGIRGLEYKVTQNDVDNRNNDRFKFRLFNTALGSLLLYNKNYCLLSDILHYSNSTMLASDSLLLDSYSEIIGMYLETSRINKMMPFWFEQQFPLLDMRQGVYNNELIKSWINKYLALLMLRAEHVNHSSGNEYKLEMPTIPQTIADKQSYIRCIRTIVDVAKSVSSEINIDSIFSGLSQEQEVVIDKLNTYIKELSQKIETQENDQVPDVELTNKFCDSVKEATNKFKGMLDEICMETTNSTNTTNIGFFYCEVQTKSIYCKDQGYSADNYHNAIMDMVDYNLKYNFCTAMSKNSMVTEVCSRIDLLKILDRLQLNKNHIIISSSADYEQWFNDKLEKEMKQESDTKYIYHETPFLKLNLGIRDTRIWILDSNDLLGYKLDDCPLNTEFITERTRIDKGVFANIIDLNGKSEVIEKLKKIYGNKYNYNKSVLELLDVNIKLNFIEHPHIIQIILIDQWDRRTYKDWSKVKTFNEYLS